MSGDYSAFKERTREFIGHKKTSTLEKPETQAYRKEVEKLRGNYQNLYDASKNWSDSLAKVKIRSEQLNHALEDFGEHHIHRGGPSLAKGAEIFENLQHILNKRYIATTQNFIYPINNLYLHDVHQLVKQEKAVNHDRLVLEDAATNVARGSPKSIDDRKIKQNKFQVDYNSSFQDYENRIADLQHKTEDEVPLHFKNFMQDLYLLFKEGNDIFKEMDINIRLPKLENSLGFSDSLGNVSSPRLSSLSLQQEKDNIKRIDPIGSPNQ
ncbi:hypothetical protein DFA_11655 [Cavenderia fasciculata]|uniref:BAR domain-containing protein n=1 Tax=Cavenderia fasciculata TaxID=261658 RepID=F4QDU7_CACFS|nr:uncharacterized protein DFA_11655 [Cavenderia fasciculata]EGG13894.1 hypothetical protein DFA_11655 [Cavenderia fasciculata]|eukprot:XP_004350602.1 hypothetical protein DFA_11655 [Cavenderia fasciculata]